MAKQMKIEVSSGEVMYADFLPELAPKTCEALQADLPYESKTMTHGRFSGHAVYVFTGMTLHTAECSRSYGVAPGDVLYNPHVVDDPGHPNELLFVYGPSAIRGVAGFGSANLCARIRHEYLPALYALGIDINRRGERPVKITLEDI